MDESDILITATQKDESISSTFNRTEKAAAIYQSAVHQTGGAVRPDKYRWYLFNFNGNKINGHILKIKNKYIKNYGYQSHRTTNTTT